MNSWYAQKLLADDYAAERRSEANRHRRVRTEARQADRSSTLPSAPRSTISRLSRWRAALAVLAHRQPAAGRAPASTSAPVRSGHATAAS